jgi:hypothetical protein
MRHKGLLTSSRVRSFLGWLVRVVFGDCPSGGRRHRWESIACATNDGPQCCLDCGVARDKETSEL